MSIIRILQLTDLHVFKDPDARLKGIPTWDLLRDVVEHVAASGVNFDHVVITGDHTHDEQPASYQAVRELLTPWIDRLWLVPGNHDDRQLLRRTFPERISGQGDDQIRFSFRAGEWRCLGLDTHVPGAVPGLIDQEQVDAVATEIEATSAACVALFLHHPPVDVGSAWMDPIGLQGRERLQELVIRDDRIRLICCGHVHHEFAARLGAATVVTTPATGIQFSPAGTTPTMSAAAPGYRIVEFDGDQFQTHVVRLPEIRFRPIE